VLVTGPTGSGKSTTLASMVDLANREREDHIMTVEDPIEFLHTHKRCLVNQREVGEDTKSFASALKHVLRQDLDIILVGELRDLETISIALTAAETGHLVFATLHTQDAPRPSTGSSACSRPTSTSRSGCSSDPRRQDPPDLLGHAGRRPPRHADHGPVPGRPAAPRLHQLREGPGALPPRRGLQPPVRAA
jgi:energy-coupling factor transporter ATP-binding protein EcfA2